MMVLLDGLLRMFLKEKQKKCLDISFKMSFLLKPQHLDTMGLLSVIG